MAARQALAGALVLLCLNISPVSAIDLNLSSIDSITSVSKTLAYDLMTIYQGNLTGQIPGMLPFPPYYWWESGGLWGTMIDYWAHTNDSTYNDIVQQGMLFQVGPDWDYMPPNQTNGMGNDDQGFWGMAAMTAAELNFPNPPPSNPQWLSLAQAVFNEFVGRFQIASQWCGGGLRWQVYFWDDGWNYKNSISNGCLFNLGARLARYTGNDTYAAWAETTWDWITQVGLMELQPYSNASKNFSINGQGAGGYIAWDGATVQSNCSEINGIPYTYNTGVWLFGAATMYNYTNGSSIWANRTLLILNATLNAFFPNSIAVEVSCEENLSCDTDMFSFKAYLTRSMAATTQMAPFTKDLIVPALAASAKAAALQCSGGENGRMCGLTWVKGAKWDGTQGAGQQMSALEVVMSNLLNFQKIPPLVTGSTGGTSVGNASAGSFKGPVVTIVPWSPPTEGDIVGAGFVTAFILIGMMAVFIWMCVPYWEPWNILSAEESKEKLVVMSGSLFLKGSEVSGNEKGKAPQKPANSAEPAV